MTIEYDAAAKGWVVIAAGVVVAGPFASNAQAWRWLDRCEGEPVSRSEQVAQWLSDRD